MSCSGRSDLPDVMRSTPVTRGRPVGTSLGEKEKEETCKDSNWEFPCFENTSDMSRVVFFWEFVRISVRGLFFRARIGKEDVDNEAFTFEERY